MVPTSLTSSTRALAGRMVIAGDSAGSVMVLDCRQPANLRAPARWLVHRNCIFAVAFVAGEQSVVTACADATAKAVDIEAGAVVATFSGHSTTVRSLATHSDNPSIIFTGGRDGRICSFDTRDLSKYRGGSPPFARANCTAADPPTILPSRTSSGLHAPAGRGAGKPGPLTRSLSASTSALATGSLAASATAAPASARIAASHLAGSSAVTALVQPSGTPLLISGGADGVVNVWDSRMLRRRSWQGKCDAVFSFSPSQHTTCGWGQSAVSAMPEAAGLRAGRQRAGRRGVTSMDLRADGGGRLLVRCMDHVLRVYRVDQLASGPEFALGGVPVTGFYSQASLAPGGEAVLAAGADGSACVWSLTGALFDAGDVDGEASSNLPGEEPSDWWSKVPLAAPQLVLPCGPRGTASVLYDVAWAGDQSSPVALTASNDCAVRVWHSSAASSGAQRGREASAAVLSGGQGSGTASQREAVRTRSAMGAGQPTRGGLASGGEDGTLRVWALPARSDLSTGAPPFKPIRLRAERARSQRAAAAGASLASALACGAVAFRPCSGKTESPGDVATTQSQAACLWAAQPGFGVVVSPVGQPHARQTAAVVADHAREGSAVVCREVRSPVRRLRPQTPSRLRGGLDHSPGSTLARRVAPQTAERSPRFASWRSPMGITLTPGRTRTESAQGCSNGTAETVRVTGPLAGRGSPNSGSASEACSVRCSPLPPVTGPRTGVLATERLAASVRGSPGFVQPWHASPRKRSRGAGAQARLLFPDDDDAVDHGVVAVVSPTSKRLPEAV